MEALAGFPEYLQGAQIVAASAGPAREPLTITFTPATLDLVLFLRCEDHGLAPGYELQATVSAGEVTAHETICREDVPLWDADEQARFWDSTGIGVGEPVTVTARLTAARHQVDGAAPELEVPEQGTFAAAVAEVVPFEEYPLPAAPSAPAPLPEPASAGVVARADSSDPLPR